MCMINLLVFQVYSLYERLSFIAIYLGMSLNVSLILYKQGRREREPGV